MHESVSGVASSFRTLSSRELIHFDGLADAFWALEPVANSRFPPTWYSVYGLGFGLALQRASTGSWIEARFKSCLKASMQLKTQPLSPKSMIQDTRSLNPCTTKTPASLKPNVEVQENYEPVEAAFTT